MAAAIAAAAHRSLSKRVFGTIFTIAMAIIVALTGVGTALIQNRLATLTHEEISNQLDVVAAALNGSEDEIAMLSHLEFDNARVTLVDLDGSVLYDSQESPAMMPNHKDRPEISQAFKEGRGSSERSSSTLGEVMLYEAKRLDDGRVVRLSQAQSGFLTVLLSVIGPILAMALVCIVGLLFVARREVRAIIAPLRDVDLDHPRRNADAAYAEMAPMLERIESQRQELKRQMRVLADNDRMRREFTANVTHELKTPLTTISGYAELIENGLVASEDDQRDFGRRIHSEATRLAALVNDILTLSSLDEAEHGDAEVSKSVLGASEPVDLSRVVDAVCQRLDPVADASGIALVQDTGPVIVFGLPRLLDEMIYNLTNNAIRYNRENGSVNLYCGADDEGRPYVRVQDTGIGIAPEECGKIFERFYRVDKSRSKARGGTGLGLAIVKHAAVFHHAQIDVQSELGQGTTITVLFPVQDPSLWS